MLVASGITHLILVIHLEAQALVARFGGQFEEMDMDDVQMCEIRVNVSFAIALWSVAKDDK